MLIRHLLCVFFACLTLAGCATSKSSNTKKYQVENFVTSAASCHQWFNQLDRIVDRDGARDFGPAMVEDYPLPKASQPNDIADAVLFFALGTSMATGQLLSVDGGQTLG